ncbi:MAG: hypothetical protein GY679_01265 [Mycoplasma sp.]|nr:hypothetical protein [Mycoplasma sp.]
MTCDYCGRVEGNLEEDENGIFQCSECEDNSHIDDVLFDEWLYDEDVTIDLI